MLRNWSSAPRATLSPSGPPHTQRGNAPRMVSEGRSFLVSVRALFVNL